MKTSLRVDLHVHSDRSDGRYPPAEVLAAAAAGGLDVLALADHDLPGALAPGAHEVDGRSIRVLAATELSGTHEGREYHLLAYFPTDMPEDFRIWVRSRAQARAARYDAARDALGHERLPAAPPEAHEGTRTLTRHHIAQGLRATGHEWEEIAGLLREGGAVPVHDVSYVEAIERAAAAGAFTSWAHPRLEDAQAHVGTFVKAGLHGLEAQRPSMKRPTKNGLRRLATRHGLLLTGGSDWHGWGTGKLGLFSMGREAASAFLTRLDGKRPAA